MSNQDPHPSSASKISKLVLAILGDVHWGHPNTPTEHILSGLRKTFPNSPTTGDIDFMIFEGDMFDRELAFRDPNIDLIESWVGEILRTCKDRNITLRVLEGTPSHDWKQSRCFDRINKIANIGADVRYVSELSIEYIEKFNMHVLYIPDEWRVRCDDTWLEVLSLLKKHGLDMVDLIVMHGAFHHQMPTNLHARLELHSADRYMSICRRYVLVGHIHQWSRYGNVIASGSWDRLTHGDENPKGYTRITLRDDKEDDTVEFVPNTFAMRYDTVDCRQLSIEQLKQIVDFKVKDLPEQSRVRLKCHKSDPAATSEGYFQECYPHLFFDIAVVAEDEEDIKPVLVDMRPEHVSLRITRSNIGELLINRIVQRHPKINVERMSSLLKEVADSVE